MKFIGFVAALLAAVPAYSQSAVVACDIGNWSQITRSDVCRVLHSDTEPLRTSRGNGPMECMHRLARDLDLGGPYHNEGVAISTAAGICSEIGNANPQWVRR